VRFSVNNRAGQSHDTTRVRKPGMWRFKSAGQAQRFVSAHTTVQNLFNLRRHLVSAYHYRHLRVSAFTEWSRVDGLMRIADLAIRLAFKNGVGKPSSARSQVVRLGALWRHRPVAPGYKSLGQSGENQWNPARGDPDCRSGGYLSGNLEEQPGVVIQVSRLA